MYHSIGDNAEFFAVKLKEFEKQVAYLVEHKFNVISASSLSAMLVAKQSIPPKTVVLTFDDGYEDNYHLAFPVLKKYRLPAAIFLITDRIGQTNTTRRGNTFPMLNWVQIKEMQASGLVEFYPHSLSHPKLDQLSEEEVTREVRESRTILEEYLNRPAPIFAYPYGRYNQTVLNIMKEQNFKAAFTVKTGRIKEGHPLFELKRNSIDSAVSPAMFKGIIRHGRI